MKKKLLFCAIIGIICIAVSWFVSKTLFIFLIIMSFLCLLTVIALLILNKLLKKTNWYNNIFGFHTQFISNAQYRHDLNRNYDIVNVGSNPARFAFFYENIKGQNWSTGAQGPEMDLEILKLYHSLLKDNGVVLIPIVAFSSLSCYLERYKPSYISRDYYVKFANILDGIQLYWTMKDPAKIKRFILYPLFYNIKAIRYIIRDVNPDNRLSISEQPMQLLELINDADMWMNLWKDEFDIKDLNAPLNDKLKESQEATIKRFADIVEFCLEREYRPVLIFPPISKVLEERFTPNMRDLYLYPLTKSLTERYNIPFLDYLGNDTFADNSLFFNSLFMNLRGRKLFTKDVLNKLDSIYGCK